MRAKALGYLMHLAAGEVFALVYYAIFAAIATSGWLLGMLFGLLHGVVAATALVSILLPVVHPRMGSTLSAADSSPLLEPPGFLMRNYGRGTPIATLLAHTPTARSSAASPRSPTDHATSARQPFRARHRHGAECHYGGHGVRLLLMPDRSRRTPRLEVVVAGGGVASLELVLALNDLAGDRVGVTVVAPEVDFTYRPPSTAETFALGYVERYRLARLADELGARLVPDGLARVAPERHELTTTSGAVVPYDRLVLAVGARPFPAFRHAITLGDQDTTETLSGLVSDLELGVIHRVAFVVPSGASWTLPLYELAIMTARHGWRLGIDDARYWFVTPEPEPLATFGAAASLAVGEMLEPEGITFIGSARSDVQEGAVLLDRLGERIEVDRIVCLLLLDGPGTPGVPTDSGGFIPVDADGRVRGVPDVYAVGDATTFPIKQGGLACQQADAVAELISAAAGAPVEPTPFRPVLRGKLMTGGRDRFLRSEAAGGTGPGEVSEQPLWWPPTKIAGRYLSPYLLGRDEVDLREATGSTPHVAVDVPLDGMQ